MKTNTKLLFLAAAFVLCCFVVGAIAFAAGISLGGINVVIIPSFATVLLILLAFLVYWIFD